MASAGLLALIDDIATLLDDVLILTKIAAKKTAGVLGDDLALNAEQVSGVRAERELPVVWAVAKGSAKNKLILVPGALLLSAFVPWIITPLLMLGGIYLCFEGFEKVAHSVFHDDNGREEEHQVLLEKLSDPAFDLVAFEKDKIKGAVRTDFILSAEVVVIALGTVQNSTFSQQALVVSLIAAVITVGVYGIVAGIVKLDDAGMHLMAFKVAGISGRVIRSFGQFILSACPYLMKTLSVVGTAAMFLVGGGILVHGIPGSHDVLHYLMEFFQSAPLLMYAPEWFTVSMFNAISGIVAGGVAVALMALFVRLKPAGSE